MHVLGKLVRFVPLVVMSFLLAACVIVEDFGGYWEKGFIDHCVNEIVGNEPENRGRPAFRSKPLLMRSLRVGEYTFLMSREKESDRGGNIMFYAVDGGEFVAYRLNESKREDFLRRYPSGPVIVTSETATIPVLNEQALAILLEIASDKSYWVESRRERYNPSRRKDCIQAPYIDHE